MSAYLPAPAVRIVDLIGIAADVRFDIEDMPRPPCDRPAPPPGVAGWKSRQFAARL